MTRGFHSEEAQRPKNLRLGASTGLGSFAAEPALSGSFSLEGMLMEHAKGASG